MEKQILKTIPVGTEDMMGVKKADFEYQSVRDLLEYLSVKNMDNAEFLTSQVMQSYLTQLTEKKIAFEDKKSTIEQKYILPALNDNTSLFNWELDYSSKLLTIYQ